MRFVPAVLGAAAGAVGTFFLDPQSGHRRRTQAVDRTTAAARRSRRAAMRARRSATAELEGRGRAAVHALSGSPRPVASEETLADRVRSELFRDLDGRRPSINVNVERECLVVLRGEVDSAEAITTLERRARAIPGVRDVENLLHTPGTPAAMHT